MCFMKDTSAVLHFKTGLRQGEALLPILFNIDQEKKVMDMDDDEQLEIVVSKYLLFYVDDIIIPKPLPYVVEKEKKIRRNYAAIWD